METGDQVNLIPSKNVLLLSWSVLLKVFTESHDVLTKVLIVTVLDLIVDDL